MEKMQNTANSKNWKALIKPSKIDVKSHDNKSVATITAEPLEKGYGLTIGNSLRRILNPNILTPHRMIYRSHQCGHMRKH